MRYIVGFKLRMFGLGVELVADHSARLNFGPRLEISLAVAFMLHEIDHKRMQNRCLERYWSVFFSINHLSALLSPTS